MMLAHGIALTQTNGERLNPMNIYPTYTSGDWVNGTVLIAGLREYYSGIHRGMRQLPRIPHQNVLNYLTRVKPYEHLPHIQS